MYQYHVSGFSDNRLDIAEFIRNTQTCRCHEKNRSLKLGFSLNKRMNHTCIRILLKILLLHCRITEISGPLVLSLPLGYLRV
jgi:hypothetical protein